MIEVDFSPTPKILKEEYHDVYEGIQSEIVNITRWDENSDPSTRYLGKSNRSKMTNLKQKSLFPYKYKEAFSLRDKIGTCPNIEVEIDVMDKYPSFIRPYQVQEEDKTLIDKEMKRLYYLGILTEGFSPYSSPIMLISRKLTKDKRVVTDFRHLHVRIAKNNLACPLFKDMFSVLGHSKCEVLSVLDFKRCITFIETIRKF